MILKIKRITLMAVLASVAACFGTGCKTYQEQGARMNAHWEQGDYKMAAEEFGKMADKKEGSKDAIIWRLEHATTLRAAGLIKESIAAFETAEADVTRYDEKAELKIGREAIATFSNQANMPYEGKGYDKIMINTYKALNYLQQGEPEKARGGVNRIYQRQKEAVEDNQKRLEKAQNEGAAKDQEIAERTKNDPAFQGAMNGAYQELNQMKVYADYVNPFSVYLDGLFYLMNHVDGADLEHASKSLERVRTYTGNTKFIQADLALTKTVMAGKPIPATTYVFFETGLAPSREQIRIDIPIIVAKVSYVGAAFPKLQFHHNNTQSLTITANGQSYPTELVASMDSVIAQDFKNELPIITTKTLIAMVTKAAAGYAVNEAATRQDPLLGLLSKIGTAVVQATMNIADLRTWTTLPKEFQVCRIATPPDRKVAISAPNGHRLDMTVGEGNVNVIWVKSVSAVSPLQATQFKLK